MRKIGVQIVVSTETDFDKEFAKVRDFGMASCQLCFWDPALYTDENAATINRCVKEYGIEVSTVWAGWTGPCEWNFTGGPVTIGLVPAAYRSHRIIELDKGSEFTAKIGVSTMATHVGFLPISPADPDFTGTVAAIRWLAQRMQARGQYFLFETGQETPVTMLRAIQAIGTDNLGINFDTANLLLYGMANTADALDVFGKYVMNTHIKDGFYPTDGLELGREVQVGEGLANLPAVLKKLKELGYTGHFTIEREITGDQQIKDIAATKEYLEKLFDELDM
ncbi:MAG: sugar phosphate isomerase/epimerase [Clostridia bacterium]|nr:sugar phosphate isomerase/epimerase [Clostridia bacterium]